MIWSDRYDGTLGDLFAFQDDVTATIAARLAVQISAAEQRLLAEARPICARTADPTRPGSRPALPQRGQSPRPALFEHAAELDPDYGRCYAGMSRTFNLAWRYHWTPKPELALDKAVDLANAAISYDNLDARSYGELGFASLYKKQHDPRSLLTSGPSAEPERCRYSGRDGRLAGLFRPGAARSSCSSARCASTRSIRTGISGTWAMPTFI